MTPGNGGSLPAHRFTAFGGARCEIIARVSDAELSAVVAEVYAFEAVLSRFRPDSELSRFNAAAGATLPVSPLLGELLNAALQAWHRSDGLVNAASLGAVVAAGYDRSIEMVRRDGAGASALGMPVLPLPEVLEVGAGWAHLTPGWGIDLGGIGKGWLADALAQRLEDAVVNLGGDLRAIGPGPEGNGWTVSLCDGRCVRVVDAGVATSGTAGRCWPGGHHLIDPRTGRPADTDVVAISVVAADALTAETLAKGAAVLGSEGALTWLEHRGAARTAVIRDSVVPALA